MSLHDTYYIIAHFHFVLSLGAIIALFLGILFYQDILFASYSFIPNSSSKNAKFHCYLSYFGINLTFTPMHFLGFNSQPRRIPDFPDYFNSWNILSSIGSGLTIFAFYLFYYLSILCSLFKSLIRYYNPNGSAILSDYFIYFSILGLHYTSEMNYAYYSVMHIIREVYRRIFISNTFYIGKI